MHKKAAARQAGESIIEKGSSIKQQAMQGKDATANWQSKIRSHKDRNTKDSAPRRNSKTKIMHAKTTKASIQHRTEHTSATTKKRKKEKSTHTKITKKERKVRSQDGNISKSGKAPTKSKNNSQHLET